jgi:hypothetical protein
METNIPFSDTFISDLHMSFLGLNCSADLHSKVPFLQQVKNATTHAAQKVA